MKITNVEVRCSERSNYSLACECDGAGYHIWLDRKTRTLEKPILYKNSLATKRDEPGYFNTRKLSIESKFGCELVAHMMRCAVQENLFEKAEQKVHDDRAAEIAETEKMRAAERVKDAAPELLAALEHMVAVSNWATTIQSEEQYDAMIATAEAAIRKAKEGR
jgi:hypothetical protein